MNPSQNEQPATIRDWLIQRGVTDIRYHHVARALGVRTDQVDGLLASAPTALALLNLNRLVQERHLALAERVWPHVSWLSWESRRDEARPVLHLICVVFGRDLLRYVEETFGEEVVRDYWYHLSVPSAYREYPEGIELDELPYEQLVFNPHLDDEEDIGELFSFGHSDTAACFRWLIHSRYSYSHYVDNRTGPYNDPMGIQLAYDLRDALKGDPRAPQPPDTLAAHLAIVHGLFSATVPDEYQSGRLPPLVIERAATLPTDRLDILLAGGDEIWMRGHDAVLFERAPVHVFVLEDDTGEPPAAIILTTRDEPGDPQQHCAQTPLRFLEKGETVDMLGLVPRAQLERVLRDLAAAEDQIYEVLLGENYALHPETGIFSLWRCGMMSLNTGCAGPIPVYRVPGGYMLVFNGDYRFTPEEITDETA